MSAPLVVNTTDGTCWTRREAMRDGEPLYAMADCARCPELVMATYAELAEHGIVGAADVLPVPVGPEPSERESLRAAFVAALDEAHHTHPCPQTGRPYWVGCVHYDESGRVVGVGSCHSERRADAVLAVRDVELERLRAQVAVLLAERHVTNEALDDAVQALRKREQQDQIVSDFVAQRAEYITSIRNCHPDNGHDYDRWQGHAAARRQLAERLGLPVAWPPEGAASVVKSADKLTQMLAPTQALRDDDPNGLRHTYRLGRDLPPIGGAPC